MNLPSITELNNSKFFKSRRKVFIDIVESLNIDKALSVSCGNGKWDYLVFHHTKNIKEIIATDVVECPVSKSDQLLLK